MLYIIHSKGCHNVHSIIAYNDMKYTHFIKREEHCRAIYLFYPYSYVTKPILPLFMCNTIHHVISRSALLIRRTN